MSLTLSTHNSLNRLLDLSAPKVSAGGNEECFTILAPKGTVAALIRRGCDKVNQSTIRRKNVATSLETCCFKIRRLVCARGNINASVRVHFNAVWAAPVLPIKKNSARTIPHLAVRVQFVPKKLPRTAGDTVVVIGNQEEMIIRGDQNRVT